MKDLQDLLDSRTELKNRYSQRDKLIREYTDIRNLKDPQERNPLAHCVTNFPMAVSNLGTHLISDAPFKIQMAMENDTPEERDKISKTERFLSSIIASIDAEERKSGGHVTRRRGNAFDAIIKGSVFNLACVLPDEESTPEFIAERWTPETCYPDYGHRKTKRFIHEYECPISEYLDKQDELGLTELNFRKGTKKVKVTDCWERKKEKKKDVIVHLMLADDQLVMPLDYAGGSRDAFTEIPIYGGAVFPEFWSLMEFIRKPVEDYNERSSYLKEAARRQIKLILALTSDRDLDQKTKDEIIKEDMAVLRLLPGETINAVNILQGFQEMQSTLAQPLSDMQLGSLSHMTWGSTGGLELSGYAIDQIRMGALANLGPFNSFLNFLDADICRAWLLAYKRGDFKDIVIAVRKKSEGRLESFVREKYSQKDVPEAIDVEIVKPLALPSNIMQKLAAMQMALPGQQLLDQTTALDEIYEADDPEIIMSRLREDMARKALTPLEVALALYQQADRLDAQAFQATPGASKRIRQVAQLTRMQAQQMLIPQQQGQQQKQPGLPRPESGGLQAQSPSEDQMRSSIGMSPPNPRRSKDTRRRLANAGMDKGGA